MLFKALIISLFFLALLSLGIGLFGLLKGGNKNPNRTVKALTWRIGLCVLLFILLIVGVATGLIAPHRLGG